MSEKIRKHQWKILAYIAQFSGIAGIYYLVQFWAGPATARYLKVPEFLIQNVSNDWVGFFFGLVLMEIIGFLWIKHVTSTSNYY